MVITFWSISIQVGGWKLDKLRWQVNLAKSGQNIIKSCCIKRPVSSSSSCTRLHVLHRRPDSKNLENGNYSWNETSRKWLALVSICGSMLYSLELHNIHNTSYQANVRVLHMSESCQSATSFVYVSVCIYLLTCSCSRLFAEETKLNECCTAEVCVFSKCVGRWC